MKRTVYAELYPAGVMLGVSNICAIELTMYTRVESVSYVQLMYSPIRIT